MSDACHVTIRRLRTAAMLFLVILALAVAGCKRVMPVDTVPLDNVGINFDSIQRLKALKITAPEVAEIAQARQAGLSDNGCVEILQIYRGRGVAFDAGDAIAEYVASLKETVDERLAVRLDTALDRPVAELVTAHLQFARQID